MTPLRRTSPERAPVVSSSAVGMNIPVPSRPPVIRSRCGSTRQPIVRESQNPRREAVKRAKAS